MPPKKKRKINTQSLSKNIKKQNQNAKELEVSSQNLEDGSELMEIDNTTLESDIEMDESESNELKQAQEWLDQEYSQKERENAKELYINKNLEGELGLSDFTNLEKVFISYFVDENNLEIKDKEKYKDKIVKLVNAQEGLEKYLAENYPNKKKSEITGTLYINSKNLEGDLEINGFPNLESLKCCNNRLTGLKITDCPKLATIYCSNNYLNNLDFLNNLNPEKLTILDIKSNNLSERNVSIFDNFTKLKQLLIGNDNKEKIEKNEYNRFVGSLNSLKRLNELGILDISNTDISEGSIESLSENLIRKITCSTEERKESQVKKIQEELYSYLTKKRLNEMYPDKSATRLTNLWSEGLKGHLDLSEYKGLEELRCYSNQLTSIDVSKNIKLKELRCYSNKLTSLDISKNTKLKKLNCSKNKLKEINLKNNADLEELICNNNELNFLEGVEDCNKLKNLKFVEEGNKFLADYKSFLSQLMKVSEVREK
jgi:Leucine-rich repeat (LRR) protein